LLKKLPAINFVFDLELSKNTKTVHDQNEHVENIADFFFGNFCFVFKYNLENYRENLKIRVKLTKDSTQFSNACQGHSEYFFYVKKCL